mgnify:CR=1 FL=1
MNKEQKDFYSLILQYGQACADYVIGKSKDMSKLDELRMKILEAIINEHKQV